MDDHPNLFGEMPDQPRLIETPPPRKPLTAEDVRAMMQALLATAQGADEMPFEPDALNKHLAMFPIMAQWLPNDEGQQLCFAFSQAIERLKKAA